MYTTAVGWLWQGSPWVRVTTGGMVCLAASVGSVTTEAGGGIAASAQTFQLAGSSVTVAGQVLAAKLPLAANSKIVTLNMPTAEGGREHWCHHPLPLVCAYAC